MSIKLIKHELRQSLNVLGESMNREVTIMIMLVRKAFSNCLIESFFHRKAYPICEASKIDAFNHIELLYNSARRHGYNGNVSPKVFEGNYQSAPK